MGVPIRPEPSLTPSEFSQYEKQAVLLAAREAQ
jgi:hypothetical protein